MKGLLWVLLGVAALLWSGVAWLLYTITGSGGAAVVTVTRWLEIDPASTQWIADTLATAGGVAQWLVILVWLIGMTVIGILTWLVSQAMTDMNALARSASTGDNVRLKPSIEGHVHKKTIS